MDRDLYVRSAVVERVIDGDTVVLDVDLGFYLTTKQTVRIAYINAPEVTGEQKADGLNAKFWLEGVLPPGAKVTVQTVKPKDKYGRYLATIMLYDGSYVHDLIVAAGHALRVA